MCVCVCACVSNLNFFFVLLKYEFFFEIPVPKEKNYYKNNCCKKPNKPKQMFTCFSSNFQLQLFFFLLENTQNSNEFSNAKKNKTKFLHAMGHVCWWKHTDLILMLKMFTIHNFLLLLLSLLLLFLSYSFFSKFFV